MTELRQAASGWDVAREAVDGAILCHDAVIELLEELRRDASPDRVEQYLVTARRARRELADIQRLVQRRR